MTTRGTMMLRGIDISNWQRGFDLAGAKPGFAIMKATEGVAFTDRSCESFVQSAITAGIPWGFYHFARSNGAATEATYFYDQTKGYVGKGIPVLDFETSNSNEWLERFCKTYYDLSGIYPWVYMSSDYVNNRGYGTAWVKEHCGLWLAGYPKRSTTYPSDATCPYRHAGWTLAAWQFTDRLSIGGMSVDGDLFYGDNTAWNRYAGVATGNAASDDVDSDSDSGSDSGDTVHTLEPLEVWKVARQVTNGVYGTGDSRKAALGSNYDIVQGAVNTLINGSDKTLAQIVLTGAMGDGQTRKYILGGRYAAVQAQVNKLSRR